MPQVAVVAAAGKQREADMGVRRRGDEIAAMRDLSPISDEVCGPARLAERDQPLQVASRAGRLAADDLQARSAIQPGSCRL